MRKAVSIMSLLLLIVFLAGCGETLTGVSKDSKRIGSGVRKIFIRE